MRKLLEILVVIILFALPILGQGIETVNGWEFSPTQFLSEINFENTKTSLEIIEGRSFQNFWVDGMSYTNDPDSLEWGGQGNWIKYVDFPFSVPDSISIDVRSDNWEDIEYVVIFTPLESKNKWSFLRTVGTVLDSSSLSCWKTFHIDLAKFKKFFENEKIEIIHLSFFLKSKEKKLSHVSAKFSVDNWMAIDDTLGNFVIDSFGDPPTAVTDIQNHQDFVLAQNYPNPFNPSTLIKFSIPVVSNVTLRVYDMLGQEVATVLDQFKSAGKYEVNFDASRLTSGTYVYIISAGNIFLSNKMTFIK